MKHFCCTLCEDSMVDYDKDVVRKLAFSLNIFIAVAGCKEIIKQIGLTMLTVFLFLLRNHFELHLQFATASHLVADIYIHGTLLHLKQLFCFQKLKQIQGVIGLIIELLSKLLMYHLPASARNNLLSVYLVALHLIL